MNEVWIGVLVIALITYATRLLPMMTALSTADARKRPAWLEALGPCLLAGMTVTILIPEIVASRSHGTVIPLSVALCVTGLVMKVLRDPGIATLAGTFAWWIACRVVLGN